MSDMTDADLAILLSAWDNGRGLVVPFEFQITDYAAFSSGFRSRGFKTGPRTELVVFEDDRWLQAASTPGPTSRARIRLRVVSPPDYDP